MVGEIVPSHIFRAYDIRGIYNVDLSPATMQRIGFALGMYARERNERSVVVGNDIRATSIMFANALISGLLYAGVDVTDVGTTSFGVCAFSGWQLKKDIVAYVTASHLPPEWNGLKLYTGEGVGFQAEANEKISAITMATATGEYDGVPWSEIGHYHKLQMREEYIEYVARRFHHPELFEGRKIAVDCGNGSMGLVAPDVMRRVHLRAHVLFPEPDPAFPNRPSEPTESTLGALKSEIQRTGVDFGAAFDGDGDRVVIVDDHGRVLSADQCGTILGKALLKEQKRPGSVLANVECSMLIERELGDLCSSIHRVPVGHTFLTREAKRTDAVLGIESSGHYVIPSFFPFDDAMVVPLIIAEILTRTGKRLSELVDELPSFPKERRNIKCAESVKFKVIDTLAVRLRAEYGSENININTMDGIRIDLEDGWVLIRASNTSPMIRVTVEGATEAVKQKLMAEFVRRTEEILKELS